MEKKEYKLNIDKALSYASMMGKDIKNVELAKALFPESSVETAKVRLANLKSGKIKGVLNVIEWIDKIHKMTGCSIEVLLGIKD